MRRDPPGDPSPQADPIWRPHEQVGAPPPPDPALQRLEPIADREARPHRRSRRRKWILGVVLLLLVLGADAAYVGLRLSSSLRGASRHLEQARDRFEQGDVDGAEAEIREAAEGADAALSLRPHPAYALGSLFADGQAVTDIALAAEDASGAGLSAIEAARALGVTSGRKIESTVYEGGRIRFDALAEAEPLIAAAAARLDEAAAHLADAPEPMFSVVGDALRTATDEVDRARDAATKGSVAFEALPSLLGRDTPRTYLLAFQALGEARATGGVIGFYGVLDARDGRLSLQSVGPIHDLGRTDKSHPVEAPPWFERSYTPQFALRQALQVNVSPRVPVVAEVLLEMYEASRGQELDGVLFMDPLTMQALLKSTGPISIPGFEGEIGPDNAADVLLRQSYLDFDAPARQNLFLGAVIREFWRRIEAGELNGAELARAVTEQVARKHFMVYARDEDDGSALARLEADGDFTAAGPVVQQVFNNNYSVNKVDYFLRRTVETRIDLTADGDARVRTSVTMRNEAPPGPPSLLLGPPASKPEDPPGLNRMVLGFLLPKGAQPHQFFVEEGADPQDPFVYSDSGRPVVWDIVEILPGETRTVSTTYLIPDAIETGLDGGEMRFVLWPQTRVTPDEYRVVVSPPEGFVVGRDDDLGDGAALLRFRGSLDEDREIRFFMRQR